MKLSVTTLGCPEWTLAQIIDRVHGYGYHGIDLRGLGDTLDVTLRPEFSTQIDRTRALLESHGLVVSGFSSSALCYADSVEKADASRAEVERYCVWPGQACSYMVGKLTWLRLRARAKAALGDRFDIREFHDAGLLPGATPLTVLDGVIAVYTQARLA